MNCRLGWGVRLCLGHLMTFRSGRATPLPVRSVTLLETDSNKYAYSKPTLYLLVDLRTCHHVLGRCQNLAPLFVPPAHFDLRRRSGLAPGNYSPFAHLARIGFHSYALFDTQKPSLLVACWQGPPGQPAAGRKKPVVLRAPPLAVYGKFRCTPATLTRASSSVSRP